MRQRKYSVTEIDLMRGYLASMSSFGFGKNVEDRLRTYMLNGTGPEELKKAYEEAFDSWTKNRRIADLQMKAISEAVIL